MQKQLLLFIFSLGCLVQHIRAEQQHLLQHIPGILKMDTIPVDPRFVFTDAMSFAFDTNHVYILDAKSGNVLQLNQHNDAQVFISLTEQISYKTAIKKLLSQQEIKNSSSIEKEVADKRFATLKKINFHYISLYKKNLYISCSIPYYKKDESLKNVLSTRDFILQLDPVHFSVEAFIGLTPEKDFFFERGPIFVQDEMIYVPVGFPRNSLLNQEKKYLLAKYSCVNGHLQFLGFDENCLLPEEHTRLGLGYHFLNYSTYGPYFSFPYTKTIQHANSQGIAIEQLPPIDTLLFSRIPDVRTNYMNIGFAVEYPVTHLIAKFDDGKVKLFSYDYTNQQSFKQTDLPILIKTMWPGDDKFAFTSVSSFIHMNLRTQSMVKYMW
jgi:hypothetical protein